MGPGRPRKAQQRPNKGQQQQRPQTKQPESLPTTSQPNAQFQPANEMPTIRPIDKDCIKFISAGEKISDIESAVRELVENSIDAEAKNIEITLVNFGADSIIVDDNGNGIDEIDVSHIGERYYTSKISNFKELQESLTTFGFRGEALSCLATIADLSIVTKAKSSPTGTKLSFKKDGTLSKREPTARGNGTTIMIKNLFHSLPVRRRELELTAKRQYDKVVRVIYEHLLARPHIKFILSKKWSNKKEKDFAHGATTLEKCIISIYGVNTLSTLIPIKQVNHSLAFRSVLCLDPDSSKRESKPKLDMCSQGTSQDDNSSSQLLEKLVAEDFEPSVAPDRDQFFKRSRSSKFSHEQPIYTIHGYISKVNCGRNSTDCQFIFVNKKPCDIPKISRLINDTYRVFTPNQHPFYCLFIEVETWATDFNVPRKRAVILREENLLCDLIKKSLEEMYQSAAPATQTSCSNAMIPLLMAPGKVETRMLKSSNSPVASTGDIQRTKRALSPVLPFSMFNHSLKKPNSDANHEIGEPRNPISEIDHTYSRMDLNGKQNLPSHDLVNGIENIPGPLTGQTKSNMVTDMDCSIITDADKAQPAATDCSTLAIDNNLSASNAQDYTNLKVPSPFETNSTNGSLIPPLAPDTQGQTESNHTSFYTQILVPEDVPNNFHVENITSEDDHMVAQIQCFEDLPKALERERAQRLPIQDSKEFTCAIHPTLNRVAEHELQVNLNKSALETMQVLGQFNKGFIIARMNNHIFIIDQHATDERANFEDQLEKCPLEKQLMVRPKAIYFNSIQENAIINNLAEFEKRGFEFLIDETKLVGLKVQLTAISVCKGQGMDDVYLNEKDLEELVDVALECPNLLPTYKLKKLTSVAASRSCRKSVMIGDSLSMSKMETIVARMSHLENPWACAHGRPTIRHLMDTDWTAP